MDIKECRTGMDVTYYRPRSGSSSSATKHAARIEKVARKQVLIRYYGTDGQPSTKCHHTNPDLLEPTRLARSG
jgi:hypothetical protein